MSTTQHFVKDVFNGIEIDRPANHDLANYSNLSPYGNPGEPINKYDHPMSALHSLKFKEVDEDELAVFTVQFKVQFDSVQELACGFFYFTDNASIVKVLEDGIIVEADAYAQCNIDVTEDIVKDTYGYPIDCAYQKEIVRTNGLPVTEQHYEDANFPEDHMCGMIYEYAIAIHKGGSSTAANHGDTIEMFFNDTADQETIFGLTDDEVREEMWEEPEILETVTAPDGTQWRVISTSHQD